MPLAPGYGETPLPDDEFAALLPHVGYENSSMLAKEAYATGRPIRDLILEKKLLTQEAMDIILSPEEMTVPGIAGKKLLVK